VFNVELFPNPENKVSLKRSKAVGEPPLLLGLSVWAAVKNALSYAGGRGAAHLNLPATGEEILLRLLEIERIGASAARELRGQPAADGPIVPAVDGAADASRAEPRAEPRETEVS
jgi:hypothetical protein